MRKNTIPCPNCHEALLTIQAIGRHIRIAAASQSHVTIHQMDCASCHKSYGLITVAETRDYLFVLVKPERLQSKFKNVWRLMQRGLKIAQLRKKLDEATVWGKRPRCRHSWQLRQIHQLGFLKLACKRCGAEREEAITATNVLEFILKPLANGAGFPKKTKQIIDNAVLPRKQQILAEAARQLDARLKTNQKRRRKLRELRRLCNTLALVT